MSVDFILNQRLENLLDNLNMEQDKLLGAIEDGLLEFETCLDSFKVCCINLDTTELII